jgi:hypothetical protein
MNIAFVTEMGFFGKIPRTHRNMRVEFAWMCALNATHIPCSATPTEAYDLIVVILPKKNLNVWISENYIEKFRKFSKKLAIMQEGPHWYFQDYDIQTQFWFYNVLVSLDIIFTHNQVDKVYYEGITGHKSVYVMPSLMIEELVSGMTTSERNGVMVGGNFVNWYGGFDSYIVAMELNEQIYCPSMGRKQSQEDDINNIAYLPYLDWCGWMEQLSSKKCGIHLMRTHAAGTFSLNCAYFGIPCIGYKGLDTQEICHPNLTVNLADTKSARELAKKLLDKDFYEKCSTECKKLYEKNYKESVFINYMNEILVKEIK